MRITFDGLREPMRLDGVWRYPGETARLSASRAKEHIARGWARPADKAPSVQATTVAEPGPSSQPRLYFNGSRVNAFPARSGVAVSVIVPLYRSGKHLPALLASLDGSDETPFETVLVSDGDGVPDVPGKLVVHPENRGFAAAVNEGVRHAAGDLFCLLNADVVVTRDWLKPMASLLASASDAGAVGNRHLNRRGRIDSIGSEFSYASGNCEHVLLDAPDRPGDERDRVAERDVMTAACLLARRSAWEQVGGLDEAYRIGYFEDSDFCLRLREAGWRILYCPGSVITHYKNHSGAGRHEHYAANKRLFHKRWVRTGVVDKHARARGRRVHEGDVVACYIVLNEAEYIQASLESVYPLADRIVIVEGGNDYAVAAGLCGPDKRSMDATVERVRSFPDPDGKIELVQGAWADKAEQRNAYAQRLNPGDWMLLMDGDEVFHEDGLWRLSALMHDYDIIRPAFHLFWNDVETVGTGVWDDFRQVKAVRWRKGDRYRDHNCPSDARGCLVTAARRVGDTDERLYAHYAWVKPVEKLRLKAAYYGRQPGARERIRPNYMDEVFLAWRRTPLEVVSRFGTHPFGGGGAEPFLGAHPKPILRRLAELTREINQ